MNWWLTLGSLAGVLLLAGAARLLGLGGADPLTGKEARRLVEEDRPGFRATGAALSVDGMAALVRGTDGTLVLVKRHGARPAFRALAPRPALRGDGERVVVDSGDRRFGGAVFEGEELERLG